MKQFIVTALALLLLNGASSQCIVQDAAHKDTYHLCFNSAVKHSFFTIIDSTGKLLWTRRVKLYRGFNKAHFSTKHLPAGIYTLTIDKAFTGTIIKT